MADKLVFEKTPEKSGEKTAHGFLKWDTASFSAISGGFGKGPLPDGEYTVRRYHVVVGDHLESGYKDEKTGERWFVPLEPDFTVQNRGGFGIHPDGSPKGTLGCIGLSRNDASRFWKKWMDTKLSNRPTKLTVK